MYEPYVTYKGHGSFGSKTVVDVNGKVSRTLKFENEHYSGPFSFDLAIDGKLPFENVKIIKYHRNINGHAEEKKLQVRWISKFTFIVSF